MISRKTSIFLMLAAFIITVIICVLAFAKLQIYPGSKFTILVCDMNTQFLPFFSSLRYIGKGDCSFMFSMHGGLGSSYMANLAYYTASPVNLLTIPVSLGNMPDAIYYLTLLRLGLCSVSFCFYTLYGIKQVKYKEITLLLSVAYGASPFNLLYSMCLMWLDAIMMLPLILVGIEVMLRKKKITVLVLTITASLYFNYYITYMTGLFSCMYLIYRLVSLKIPRKEAVKLIAMFVLSSAISVGASMPLLLPALKYMALGKATEAPVLSGTLIRVPLFRIIRNLFPFGEFYMNYGGAPQIYCGIFTLILITVFFISKCFSFKEKTAASIIIIIYLLSFMLVPIDRIWHGFRDPECLPARYAFTFICFMLILACRALDSELISKLHNSLSGRSYFCFLYLPVLLVIYFNSSDVIMSVNNNSHFLQRDKYDNDVKQITHSLESIDDDGLYRVVSEKPVSLMDGYLFNYNDVGYYSSVYDAGLHEYLKHLGMDSNKHRLYDKGFTPLLMNLLGVKYCLGGRTDYYNTEYIDGTEPFALYYNPLSLPIGYLVEETGSFSDIPDNPFENQEALLVQMLGRRTVLYNKNNYHLSTVDDKDYARSDSIDVTISRDGPVWLYFPLGSDEDRKSHDIDTELKIENSVKGRTMECKCVVNGTDIYNFLGKDSSHCVYIGDHKNGDKLSLLSYSTQYYYDPLIMTMNEDAYFRAMHELAEHPFNVTSHGNGKIEGTVWGAAGKKLAVSLPYMDGYRVYIDGSRVDYARYNPAMISVEIPPGKHLIKIDYVSPGLLPGIIIGTISIIIFLYLVYYFSFSQRSRSL